MPQRRWAAASIVAAVGLAPGGVQRRDQRGKGEPVGAPSLQAQPRLREERIDSRREVVAELVAGMRAFGALRAVAIAAFCRGSRMVLSRGMAYSPRQAAARVRPVRACGDGRRLSVELSVRRVPGVVAGRMGRDRRAVDADRRAPRGGRRLRRRRGTPRACRRRRDARRRSRPPSACRWRGCAGERLALQPLVVVPEGLLGVHTRILSERARGPCHATGVRCARRARRGEGVRPASAWSSRSSAAGNRSTSGSACGSA